MKSLQFICKKQAINFAPLQSAKGYKRSFKNNRKLNQDNEIFLVPIRTLNLFQVTVGNGPVVCPCYSHYVNCQKEHLVTHKLVMQLLLSREESLLPNFLHLYYWKKGLCCGTLIL